MRQPHADEIRAWLDATREATRELDTIHDTMAQKTLAADPVCSASGRCCDFGRFGHDLFTTGLEAAVCLSRLPEGIGLENDGLDEAVSRGGCPFQIGKRCGVHPVRPSGCRAFFCDPSRDGAMIAIAEAAQDSVRKLHDRLGVPYLYSEWRRLLRGFVEAGFTRPARANRPGLVMLRVSGGRAPGA